MTESFKRNVFYYKSYFKDFYSKQRPEVQDKITWVIGFIRDVRIVPEKFFKHVEGTDGLFEIRVKVRSNIFRIFSFFDEGNLIILLDGFNKKSQKTPRNEIEKAERLQKEYFYEKGKT